MSTSNKAQRILEKIAQIQKMERGKICRMSARAHYNHQTWQGGRNIVRYVPTEELSDLQEAIDGYKLFTKLTQQYADEVIRLTRKQRTRRAKISKKRGKPTKTPEHNSSHG